jgi:hypothetical protein
MLSIIEYLRSSPASSTELQVRTGLSQATVSRQLRSLGNRIVKLGRGRATRYALATNAFGAGDLLPLYAIDPHGNAVRIASIRPLAHGGYYVERTTDTPSVLLGDQGNGVYDDLPFFLDDLRPQGFLGRQIAQILSESAGLPSDPRHWTADQVGSYLIANGDDLSGNLRLGQQSLLRLPRKRVTTRRSDYPEMAESVLAGNVLGSSAGGEQPKFTAFTEDRGHVIVKFSPAEDEPVSRRWRDILLTEYHAAKILKDSAAPAADSQIYEIGGRLFLESPRFDRQGDSGRVPMISLMAVDAEFTGLGSNWPDVIKALVDRELISHEHLIAAQILHAFGRCINNTDMHLGNLSLSYDGDVFTLLPVYDMCSMGFAPKSGEIIPYNFRPDATINDDGQTATRCGIDLAIDFWDALASDQRVSSELREFLERGSLVGF